jgi:AraC-like DNA-binding protein/mannose-6-phosphate isomerase-like protein (cupin superfamily)
MISESNLIKTKRGYLNKDFEYFHLKDQKSIEFEFHYHDFNKIIVFISGNVTYLIEGKAYKLKPWDILFVNSNDVHRPLIDTSEPYERIVIWVNSRFLELHNTDDHNLLTCFELSSKQKRCLLRLPHDDLKLVMHTLMLLDEASKDKEFGNYILKNALFVQLIVYLNRLFLRSEEIKDEEDVEYDERIENIINYIKENLNEDLSIDTLASRFYMSKYHLMHKFKAQTGYTLHNYIQQKRLIYASSLIKQGMKITQACMESGFGDYSSFVRAFKKTFGLSPKNYYRESMELDISYNKSKHS